MIMKHERNEDKNDFLLFLLPEIFTVIAGSTAVYAMGIFGKQLSVENALRNAVMTAMGLAVAGFFLRREQLDSQLDYDNDEHLMRFWIAVWSCLLLSLASGRRLALFTCFCGIISVQQSAGRNSFLLSVSYDCFI